MVKGYLYGEKVVGVQPVNKPPWWLLNAGSPSDFLIPTGAGAKRALQHLVTCGCLSGTSFARARVWQPGYGGDPAVASKAAGRGVKGYEILLSVSPAGEAGLAQLASQAAEEPAGLYRRTDQHTTAAPPEDDGMGGCDSATELVAAVFTAKEGHGPYNATMEVLDFDIFPSSLNLASRTFLLPFPMLMVVTYHNHRLLSSTAHKSVQMS
ncbi:uncharacterized protein LOC122462974 [Chelonia mydas]|uniref:uncharacterized protein LOC122462974 n=1 Tax=Chelonia mydas TaxID=8469 RepID=UPI001CA84A29|nr:uncharacterized protein LOC122462974 [Chelonia mydas]